MNLTWGEYSWNVFVCKCINNDTCSLLLLEVTVRACVKTEHKQIVERVNLDNLRN